MKELTPIIEAAALRETEDALRDLMTTAQNIGCSKPSLAMMLRAVAEDLQPTIIVRTDDAALH